MTPPKSRTRRVAEAVVAGALAAAVARRAQEEQRPREVHRDEITEVQAEQLEGAHTDIVNDYRPGYGGSLAPVTSEQARADLMAFANRRSNLLGRLQDPSTGEDERAGIIQQLGALDSMRAGVLERVEVATAGIESRMAAARAGAQNVVEHSEEVRTREPGLLAKAGAALTGGQARPVEEHVHRTTIISPSEQLTSPVTRPAPEAHKTTPIPAASSVSQEPVGEAKTLLNDIVMAEDSDNPELAAERFEQLRQLVARGKMSLAEIGKLILSRESAEKGMEPGRGKPAVGGQEVSGVPATVTGSRVKGSAGELRTARQVAAHERQEVQSGSDRFHELSTAEASVAEADWLHRKSASEFTEAVLHAMVLYDYMAANPGEKGPKELRSELKAIAETAGIERDDLQTLAAASAIAEADNLAGPEMGGMPGQLRDDTALAFKITKRLGDGGTHGTAIDLVGAAKEIAADGNYSAGSVHEVLQEYWQKMGGE